MGPMNHVLDGGPQVLRDIATATNIGMQFAITGFVWMTVTRQLLMKGVWVVSQQNTDIANTPHLKDVAMATTFWLSVGYNFSCVIATGTIFDSRGGFSLFRAKLSDEDSHFRGSKGRCHGNHFLAFYIWSAIGATWQIRLNHLCVAAMRPYVKWLWPLYVVISIT